MESELERQRNDQDRQKLEIERAKELQLAHKQQYETAWLNLQLQHELVEKKNRELNHYQWHEEQHAVALQKTIQENQELREAAQASARRQADMQAQLWTVHRHRTANLGYEMQRTAAVTPATDGPYRGYSLGIF